MMPSIFSARPLSDQFGNSWVSRDFAPEYFNNSNAKAICFGGGRYIIGGLLSPTSVDTYKMSTDDGQTWTNRTQLELFGAGSIGQNWQITGLAYSPKYFTTIAVGSWNGSSSICRYSTNNGLTYSAGEAIQISSSVPQIKTLNVRYNSTITEHMFAYGSSTNKMSYSINGGAQWTDLGDLAPSGIVGSANVNDVAASTMAGSTTGRVVAVTNQTTEVNAYKVYTSIFNGVSRVFSESSVVSWPSGLFDAFVQVAFGDQNGRFVAITSMGYISYSDNGGATFTTPTRYFTDVSSSYPVKLLYFGKRFYVVYKRTGSNAGIYFRQSSDGITWGNATVITLGGMNTLWPLLIAYSSTSVVCAGHSSSTYSLSTS